MDRVASTSRFTRSEGTVLHVHSGCKSGPERTTTKTDTAEPQEQLATEGHHLGPLHLHKISGEMGDLRRILTFENRQKSFKGNYFSSNKQHCAYLLGRHHY